MSDTVQVTMGLTPQDSRDAESLQRIFQAQTKAEIVSTALKALSVIVGEMQNGSEIIVKTKSGEMKRLVFPSLSAR